MRSRTGGTDDVVDAATEGGGKETRPDGRGHACDSQSRINCQNLVAAIDKVNERWGNFVMTPARMIGTNNVIVDRVAFGGVKELEEIVIN